MLILLALLIGLGRAQFVGNAACADCHRNIVKRYAATTMSNEGVRCEDCHGEARMHAKGSGRLEIPTALEPAARDAVCGQCHFTGAARVARAGRDAARFRAGEALTRYTASFVHDTHTGQPAARCARGATHRSSATAVPRHMARHAILAARQIQLGLKLGF